MKKIYLLLFFAFLINQPLFPQNPDIKRTWHWYFGNGAGIDFSSGTAVSVTDGQLHTYEGCATISDTSGNLLFYTDGDTVWNAQHQMMPNGFGLLGCPNFGSGAQAATIVPAPSSSTIYYVITNGCRENSGIDGLRYSIIDINLDSGKGDVTQKNILLFAPSTEGVAVIYKCNKKDFWLLAHEYGNNNFRIYSIDSAGVNLNPQIQSIGSVYTDHFSQFRFSSDGKKLAAAFPTFNPLSELFNFDSETGVLSNKITLIGFLSNPFGQEFSFDNSKIYFTHSGSYVYQFDLSSNDSMLINNSIVIVGTYYTSPGPYGHMSKASDNKIYIAGRNRDSLSTIEFPNNLGITCSFQLNSFYLIKESQLGLPFYIADYYHPSAPQYNCPTSVVEYEHDVIKIFPNPARDWITVEGGAIQWLSITDILGKIVYHSEPATSSFKITVNTASLSRGVYILRVNTGKILLTRKIVLQ